MDWSVFSTPWMDKEGQPITTLQWHALKMDDDYSIIGRDTVGPYVVSTVWLGLDHSFGDGPPVLFETMVFGADDWDLDTRVSRGLPEADEFYAERYCTEDDARAGHAQKVAEVRERVTSALGDIDSCHPRE